MQNIFAFLEAPLFTLWKSCLKALKFLSDSHSAFLGRKTRMTQLVSKHSHKNPAFVTYPKQTEKNTPFMKKVVFLLLWKHEKFQLLRLWGRKSFDFQTLVMERFQFYVEIYTPAWGNFSNLIFSVKSHCHESLWIYNK